LFRNKKLAKELLVGGQQTHGFWAGVDNPLHHPRCQNSDEIHRLHQAEQVMVAYVLDTTDI